MSEENIRSCVLCLGGLDPSGGAGIQADIEAVAATGAHALTVATCLTVQNSQQALSMHAVDAHLIAQQLDCLLTDMPIHACKIGVIPNPEVATIIAAFLSRLEGIPVVFDPVMSASVGIHFAEQSNWQVIQQLLLQSVQQLLQLVQQLLQLVQQLLQLVQQLLQLVPQLLQLVQQLLQLVQ